MKWTIKQQAISTELANSIDQPKYILQRLEAIGIKTPEEAEKFFNFNAKNLYPSTDLKDMDIATNLIVDAILTEKKIRVVGDYDVDGMMSTTILTEYLENYSSNVSFAIPNRNKDAYGISEKIVNEAHEDGVDLIITCDNGITAFKPVELAKELGMKIIITDHHEITELPKADAVINPKREDCNYKDSMICGCCVTFNLIRALNLHLAKHTNLIADGGFQTYLQHVAIATIADAVPLLDQNRLFVQIGLKLLNSQIHASENLKRLMESFGLKQGNITAKDLAFKLIPKLNAVGRVGEPSFLVNLLKTPDLLQSEINNLDAINNTRKDLTEVALMDLEIQIKKTKAHQHSVLVLIGKKILHGIMGICASQLAEKYNRPCIILAGNDEYLTGSGRSINNYDLLNAVKTVSSTNNLPLKRAGGHKMAFGLSILNNEETIEKLRYYLSEDYSANSEEAEILVDYLMQTGGVSINMLQQLSCLEPFGQGNPEPTYMIKGVTTNKTRDIVKTKTYLVGNIDDGTGNLGFFLGNDVSGFKRTETLDVIGNIYLDDYTKKPKITINRFREGV